VDLSTYKWKNRLLLVFAAPGEEYEEQLRLLEGLEPEFEERDLLLGLLHEAGELDGTPVPPEDTMQLRQKFSVEPYSFATILVGKDGGEKFRSNAPAPAEEVFRRIDAMPMRRREMRG
jgi:hypothetical protein